MGFPKEIQTDEGTSFISNLAVEFAEKFGIKVTRSSVHHPQSNPVESFHRTIKRISKVLSIEAASCRKKLKRPKLLSKGLEKLQDSANEFVRTENALSRFCQVSLKNNVETRINGAGDNGTLSSVLV
ncbi:hypothetical protein AVEN_198167-1 [Araneus ventricosus]|uniref:Integrase catalytic domain-containing protein n=1 Tax=Araneus ventricosus TaxID=182803 RepID=A0A4Y2GKB0_ARAVE|nr:hypothetical protein AVEN_198167-1 [Araneus ventricosus]